jgi:hypothetical protein
LARQHDSLHPAHARFLWIPGITPLPAPQSGESGAGWYVVERDLERWPALAGYRGLRDADVHRHFNGTLYSFGAYGVDSDTWGPQEEMLRGLGLEYRVVWMGTSEESEALIKSRLEAGMPMLFYLWDPHPLIDQYKLSRIQLPRYEGLDPYLEGKTDFPIDVLEKVFSTKLASFAPEVHDFYFRFRIDNAVQRQIMRAVDSEGLSMLQATCAWLRTPANAERWGRWLKSDVTCAIGSYLVNDTSCELCPKGSGSLGGRLTECTKCAAGALLLFCMSAQDRIHTHPHTHMRAHICAPALTRAHHTHTHARVRACARRSTEFFTSDARRLRLLPIRRGAVWLHWLRQPRRLLSREDGPDIVSRLSRAHATIPRSSICARQALVSMQKWCDRDNLRFRLYY